MNYYRLFRKIIKWFPVVFSTVKNSLPSKAWKPNLTLPFLTGSRWLKEGFMFSFSKGNSAKVNATRFADFTFLTQINYTKRTSPKYVVIYLLRACKRIPTLFFAFLLFLLAFFVSKISVMHFVSKESDHWELLHNLRLQKERYLNSTADRQHEEIVFTDYISWMRIISFWLLTTAD